MCPFCKGEKEIPIKRSPLEIFQNKKTDVVKICPKCKGTGK